jgi:hypothetical protein
MPIVSLLQRMPFFDMGLGRGGYIVVDAEQSEMTQPRSQI